MVIVFKKSLLKSAAAKAFVKEAKFNYFKEKILEHLDRLEAKEKKRLSEVKKALFDMESLEKAGFPVGTIREWKGKKYIKIAPGKWKRKYDSHTRGAKLAISALKRKVDACKTSQELLQLVLAHKDRFRDANGHPLPFVQELSDYVSKANDRLEGKAIGGDKGATKKEIKAFLANAINSDEKQTLSFGLVTDEAKKRIKEKLGEGKDINLIILDSDAVRHVMKKGEHRIELKDLEKVGEIVNTTKKVFRSKKKHSDNKALLFVEEVDNGMNLVMEFRSKKGNLALVTAYRKEKKKKAEGSGATMLNTAPALTSETLRSPTSALHGRDHKGDSSPLATIQQSDDSVNNKSEKGAKSAGIAAIRKRYESFPSIEGNKKTVVLPDGSAMKCRYRLVEADAPTASHKEDTFAPTEGFPTNSDGKNVNDRDYLHDKDAQEAVRRLAANYNAIAIGDPPIVTKDGIVISGNNRTMSSKLAAKHGTDSEYLKFLREQADEYGFEASDLDDFEHPRVILEVIEEHKGEYTTEEFAQFNRDTKKTMNNVEKAVKITKTLDSEKIKSIADCLDGFETMGELYQDKKGGSKFVQALVDAGVILDNEKAQYLTSDGLLNDTGKDFVETVLVGSVLTEENIRHCDGAGGKSIRKKLVRAILPLIENKGNGKEYSFNTELNEATAIALEVSKNHDKFGTVKDYLDQLNLFDEKKIDGVTARLAEVIHDDTEKNFAARMKGLGAGLRQSAEGLQDIFLGGVETKGELMERFLEVKKAVSAALKKAFGLFVESA